MYTRIYCRTIYLNNANSRETLECSRLACPIENKIKVQKREQANAILSMYEQSDSQTYKRSRYNSDLTPSKQ